jgi:hypothetical protein
MSMPVRLATLAIFGVLAISPAAQAQQGEGDVQGQTPPPGPGPCGAGNPATGQETLSDKLSDCGGVLRPSVGMDNEIHAPAPDPTPGTTPVVPPPSTDAVPK